MKCHGCYKEEKEGYCLPCRKKLFGKARVPATLPFDAPAPGNLPVFQEHSKRLSISGVQLKYSMRLENGQLVLCEKGGQYILKPIPPSKQLVALGDVPENEHLTMQIAEQVFGINTAANALIYFKDGLPAYITRRFDVKPDGTKYPQEDFAQLTGRTNHTHGEAFKYDGTYVEIGLLVKQYIAAAMPALESFFRLVVFNYVISNGDAHLKNFSVVRTEEGEYRLSPAYDLMSTVIHTPLEADTALGLYEGDMESTYYAAYGCYGRPDFMELAKRLGIVRARAERIMDAFPAAMAKVETFVGQSFLSDETKGIFIKHFQEKLKRISV